MDREEKIKFMEDQLESHKILLECWKDVAKQSAELTEMYKEEYKKAKKCSAS